MVNVPTVEQIKVLSSFSKRDGWNGGWVVLFFKVHTDLHQVINLCERHVVGSLNCSFICVVGFTLHQPPVSTQLHAHGFESASRRNLIRWSLAERVVPPTTTTATLLCNTLLPPLTEERKNSSVVPIHLIYRDYTTRGKHV